MIFPKVSVILPFYGTFDKRRLLATIKSIKVQRGVDLDIVVSEQGPESQFPYGIPGVKHVFNQYIPKEDLSDYNPGLIRNIALSNTCGEFVYSNDSDIFFINKFFLSILVSLMQENPSIAFHKPKMRRLPLNEFENFYKIIIEEGVDSVLKRLLFDQPNIATISRREYKFKFVRREGEFYEKVYTSPMNLFNDYREGRRFKGEEPIVFLEDLHCGGNLLRRSQIEGIGGYCELYINWGCEDSDVQWKVRELYDLRMIPQEPHLEVLHLDHEKGYFSQEMWRRNEKLFLERKARGIEKVIEEDQRNWRRHK